MNSRKHLFRVVPVALALLLATLACTMTIGESDSPSSRNTPVPEKPIVRIIAPPEQANFSQGQTVTVQVSASSNSDVKRVELYAKDVQVAAQDSEFPTKKFDVLLAYRTQETGAIPLKVLAYTLGANGQLIPSDPAVRTINVLGPLDPGSGGAAGTPQTLLPPTNTPFNSLCRAHIDYGGLRFREGPGTNYNVVGNFSLNDEPQILGYAQTDAIWWQVLWQSRVGWIHSGYATQLGNCNYGPVPIPATPTPASSATPLPSLTPAPTATPQPTVTLPDLQFTLFDGPRDVPLTAAGTGTAAYEIRVRNNGGTTTGQFFIEVRVGTRSETIGPVSALAPGQEVKFPAVAYIATFDTPNPQTVLLVRADPTNVVNESNENNNETYILVNVSAAPGGGGDGDSQADQAQPQADTTCRAIIRADALNLRTGPGEAYDIVTQLFDGDAPQITGYADLPDGRWLQVVATQQVGWIKESFTTQTGDCTGISEAAYPAPPVVPDQPAPDQPDQPAPQPAGLPVITAANAQQVTQITSWRHHGGAVLDVAFSPDGSRVASASADGTVVVTDVATGDPLFFSPLLGVGDQVAAVTFSPNGSWIAAAGIGSPGTIVVWNANSGERVATLEQGAGVSALAFSPDSAQLAAGGESNEGGGLDGQVLIWDVSTQEPMTPIFTAGPVSDVVFADTTTVIVATRSRDCSSTSAAIESYNAFSGEPASQFSGHSGSANDAAVDPVHNWVAGAGQAGPGPCEGSGTVWVWNLANRSLVQTLGPVGQAITAVAFSRDGTLLVSGSANNEIRVWDVSSGQNVRVGSHDQPATCAAFSPDGTLFVTGGDDQTLRVWGVQ